MEQTGLSESYEDITEMRGLEQLRIHHGINPSLEGGVPVAPGANRVVSVYSEDWVIVPTDDTELLSPVRKQMSNCSSLEKTLSYVFATKSRDYSDRKLVMSILPVGPGRSQLSSPHGLALDRETNKLFIADTNNNRIQVYPPDNHSGLKERARTLSQIFLPDPKMDVPWGICVSDSLVFVTQYRSHCVDVYSQQMSFVARFGAKGFGNGKFSCPTGICVARKDVYICDSNNNRIQIFTKENKEFNFKKSFGVCSLTNPLDIKIFNTQIFVLDSSKMCLHRFDCKHKHLKSFIRNGPRWEVDNPKFFDVDDEGNFLISDWLNHAIKVFNCEGVKVAVIGMSHIWSPKGVATGRYGDVFVVDERGEGLLKVF